MAQAFLDIDIGNTEEHAMDMAAFQRGCDYIAAVGSQYGVGTSQDLTEDDIALLEEAYQADPSWNSKGAARFARPPSIRAGRIIIELFEQAAPKAVANFRCLCTGERGVGKGSGKPLHYKGCTFHRIVSGFVAQGGDFVRGDGSGGDSIYGGKFNDDKAALKLKHDAAGIVSMANSGKNTNSSQFYITLAPAPACDGKHVVFGRVIEGMNVVTRIGEEAASADGTPQIAVTIADCGLL